MGVVLVVRRRAGRQAAGERAADREGEGGGAGDLGLLDADANGALSATELKWTTDAHELLKKPMLKNLSLAIFAELDADADESVTEAEVQAALDGEALDRVVALLREKFPIPALDAKNLPRETMKQHVGAAIKMVDTDGDGAVGQKEIVRAAKRFKDTFMSTVKQIEAAAPMMQMMAEMQKGPAAGGAGAKPRKPRPKRELAHKYAHFTKRRPERRRAGAAPRPTAASASRVGRGAGGERDDAPRGNNFTHGVAGRAADARPFAIAMRRGRRPGRREVLSARAPAQSEFASESQRRGPRPRPSCRNAPQRRVSASSVASRTGRRATQQLLALALRAHPSSSPQLRGVRKRAS